VLVVFNFSIFSIIMENNIIEPNELFDFSGLSLAHPTGIQGGAYFTKIENNNKPLYIQTTKSVTRQGIVKTGKKYYCDLMFDKNSDVLIAWFENLENTCKKLIYAKRETWFQNGLEENDIESAFNSIIRVYKSGKYYLVRTNIKNNRSDEPAVKIYNENEVTLTINDVTTETNIISILEIQGIKFTSRNFQIDIELKQVMMLDNEPIFNSCLIKNKKGGVSKQLDILHPPLNPTNDIVDSLDKSCELIGDKLINDETVEDHSKCLDSLDDDVQVQLDDNVQDITIPNVSGLIQKSEVTTENPITVEDSLELDIENLEPENNEDNLDLKEVDMDLSLENNLETLQLKKPNQVYLGLYKEARSKAKLAKKAAIIAYLEAKNIKKTYILENLDDSDSDFDAEIDEVSESELDGL
jgi:hypothetical protein